MSKHKVKVVVRVRPKLDELDDHGNWVEVVDSKTLQVINHRNVETSLKYEFERVFGPQCAQAVVYNECVHPVVKHVVEGQNASVFAYGPTGAGKTHTILGTAKDPGVISRCVKDIFSLLKKDPCAGQWQCTVKFSYLEVYQEKVHDLLDMKPVDLPIREDQYKNIFVTGLSEKTIDNVEQFNEAFAPASKNRTTAATKVNERSSRSHSLLMIKVERRQLVAPFKRLYGKMYVIDLAGSEDNRKTGNYGVRLKESGAINTSLLMLGQVVDALNKGQTCVPYRGSKLTRLLQDSLGGNSHSTMIVNLAPEEKFYFDTYTTLHFARKSKKIVNTVKTNEVKEKGKSLKRGRSDKSSSQDKQSRTAAADADVTPPKQAKLPQPFLSPLLRNQENLGKELRRELFGRLEQLEEKLMSKMTSKNPDQEHGGMLPDSTTDDEHEKPAADDSFHLPWQEMRDFKKHHAKLLKQSSEGKENADTSAIGDSPFVLHTPVIKRKGFRSTASRPENTACSETQRAHNERILQTLNTGSVKELQDLQTVGAKRAKLIHSWREINGPFSEFESLTEVPSLTRKYLSSFLKSNLVNL